MEQAERSPRFILAQLAESRSQAPSPLGARDVHRAGASDAAQFGQRNGNHPDSLA